MGEKKRNEALAIIFVNICNFYLLKKGYNIMADKVSFNGVEFNQSFMVSDFVSWFGCQF